MHFFFDPSVYESTDEAKESLFDELEYEIGVFYRLTHLNVMRSLQWTQLQALTSDLISLHKAGGPRGAWNRFLKARSQIQEVVIAIAEFENHELWVDHATHMSYEALTRRRSHPYIDSTVKATIAERPGYECRSLRDVVRLLEGRRSKVLELTTTMLAAILGGAVGAVITLLLNP